MMRELVEQAHSLGKHPEQERPEKDGSNLRAKFSESGNAEIGIFSLIH